MLKSDMAVVISMLRGVNLGSRRIKMDALRALYLSLGLRDPQTYIQSGNVIFRTGARDFALLGRKIENAIESSFGFHSHVILRTPADLRATIASSPFASRRGIEPGKLLVTFLAEAPGKDARDAVLRLKADPEELHIIGRELYVYFPNGMARPKLSWALIDKTLKVPGTGRNWNTVTKLLEMAENLEAG